MDWDQRKAASDAHEGRVALELEARTWEWSPGGQGTFPPGLREAISAGDLPWRYAPDLWAACDGDVVAVDAKDKMRSTDPDRYAIKKDCVNFGIAFTALSGVPLFYVLGNLGVMTPTDVHAYGTLGPRARGGAYYLVPARLARHFDDVFGVPRVEGRAA
jgi:hypothetical protein